MEAGVSESVDSNEGVPLAVANKAFDKLDLITANSFTSIGTSES
jgi:hypothetical protein